MDLPKNKLGFKATLDERIQIEIDKIKKKYGDKYEPYTSCNGHEKYPMTIIVQNKYSGCCFEWFTGIRIPNDYLAEWGRKQLYQRDKDGIPFIPEVLEKNAKS